MNESGLKLIFSLVVLAGLAAIGWKYRDAFLPQQPAPVVEMPAEEPLEPAALTGPQHPIVEAETAVETPRSLVPLPALNDSDAFFLLDVGSIFGSDIESLLLPDAVIDRMVATVDNLPRDHVSEKIRPVGRLAQLFIADGFVSTEQPMTLGEENFQRYDDLVRHVSTADIDAIVDMYRRYYPLFQQSYERLGYPDAYFNDRFVEVIDHLLATPDPDQPLVLVRPNVLYEFADPELERLSSGQKLLLRMGVDHAATIKGVLQSLRARIASGQS